MNNIFIPFKSFKNTIGGPSTFMKNLYDFLTLEKFKFLSRSWRIKKADGIFFLISYDKSILSYFKENNLPIIQRLDGIYYPSKHGKDYKELNEDIKDIYLNYSSYVIFQSKYCKEQCFEMLGKLREDKYSIIHNGANNNIFYPDNKKQNDIPSAYNLVTTGNFRNIDMLEPIIYALDGLINKFQFNFNIIGPIKNEKLKKLINNRPYITNIKKADLKEVSNILRAADIFLYSHLNPPCPNSVIEAISCSLPVVGFDSGSMSELLFFARDLLAPVSGKVFQEYEEFDPLALKYKIEYSFKNFDLIKERAQKYSGLYDFNETGKEYLRLFNHLS